MTQPARARVSKTRYPFNRNCCLPVSRMVCHFGALIIRGNQTAWELQNKI